MSCNRNAPLSNKSTLTFWHSFVASTIPALEELIEKFEASHPGIEIKAQYVPTGDALVQKLITAIQSQTAPD
ncbi:extracellular solute-binding protein, partial [candidate division KSB1 bacterium]|nr:extracellular solute-binding protein [candidate division KSB1 bacterium]